MSAILNLWLSQEAKSNVQQAIQAWKAKIGTDKVGIYPEQTEKYIQNITEYSAQKPIAVLKPKTRKDVEEIVAIARDFHVPLNPVSTGKNWGLGSKLPVTDGCILVIMSGLGKIIEVNQELRYAIIEPGVTQKQLSDYLWNNTDLMFPMTGSAEDTSVVGNMLDRGSVFFDHRYDLLSGVEVVLGTGKVVRTGFWHYFDNIENHQPKFFHPSGLGPDMNGIFTQSSLGIVTSIVIRLRPRRSGTIVYLEIKEDKVFNFIDTFNQLKDDKLVHNWLMLTNKNDPRTTDNHQFNYTGNWSAIGSFHGKKEIQDICKKHIQEQLQGLCNPLNFLSSDLEESTEHPYFTILKKLYNGIPSNYSIETMGNLSRSLSIKSDGLSLADLDYEIDYCREIPGFVTVTPAIPLTSGAFKEAINLVNRVSKDFDITPFHNFVSLGEMSVEGLFRVFFNRSNKEEIIKAHRWSRILYEEFEKIGIYPYRISVKDMQKFVNRKEDTYWKAIADIKNQLDPSNIIAPGKFCLENI
ncbi:MAG: FAD-binding oxidoreductase [Cyanobacteria bacterium P01_A01_bin.45]